MKEFRNLKEQVQDYKLNIEIAERTNKKLKIKNKGYVTKLGKIIKSEQYYKKAYNEIMESFQQQSTELKNIEEKLLDSKIFELDKELKKVNEILTEKEQKLLNLNLNYNNLQDKYENLDKEYIISQEKILLLQDTLTTKINELHSIINPLKMYHIQDLKEINKDLIMLKNTCDQKTNEIDTLNGKISQYENLIQTLEQNIQDMTQNHQKNDYELKDNIISMEKALKGKSIEFEELIHKTSEKNQLIQDKIENIGNLTAKLLKLEQIIGEKDIKFDNLFSENHQKNNIIEDKSSEIAKLSKEIFEYSNKVLETEKALHESRELLINIEQHKQVLIYQIDILNNQLGESQRIILKNNNDIDNLKIKLAKNEEDLNNKNVENVNLSEKFGQNSNLINKEGINITEQTTNLKENNGSLFQEENSNQEYIVIIQGIEYIVKLQSIDKSRKKDLQEFKYTENQFEFDNKNEALKNYDIMINSQKNQIYDEIAERKMKNENLNYNDDDIKKLNEEVKMTIQYQSSCIQKLNSKITQSSFKNEYLNTDHSTIYDNWIFKAKIEALNRELQNKGDENIQLKQEIQKQNELICQTANHLPLVLLEKDKLAKEIRQ